jgi:hypothetical protein
MNKNYFLAIAQYEDEKKQHFFDNIISKRNKEYCKLHNLEYLEITSGVYPVRGSILWYKLFKQEEIVKKVLNYGDGLIFLDADALIVKKDINLLPPSGKSLAYAIDTGNTHCSGFFSVYKTDWILKFFEHANNQSRYDNLIDKLSIHEGTGVKSSFWKQFHDQAAWYSLMGIKRHSNIPFWDLPDNGWHSEKDDWTAFDLNELNENIHLFPSTYNVTEFYGESSCLNNINKVSDYNDVVIRHFAGAQKWRKVWLNTDNIYFKTMKYNLLNYTTQYKIKSFYRKVKGFIKSKLKI